ncbi:LysE family translocator [Nocardia sp. NPDC001965]
MFERIVSFICFAAVLTAIPGPAIVLVMKNTVMRGRSAAVATAVGIFCGDLVWVTTSLAGLTALLVSCRPAFEVLRFVGAAYLSYLGIRLLLRPRSDPLVTMAADAAGGAQRSHQRAFGEGVLCELSNPKALIVFTSVIPPFAPADSSPFDLAIFGMLFATTGLATCILYAIAVGRVSRVVRLPRFVDTLLRVSGGVLVAFGAGLAVEGAGGDPAG